MLVFGKDVVFLLEVLYFYCVCLLFWVKGFFYYLGWYYVYLGVGGIVFECGWCLIVGYDEESYFDCSCGESRFEFVLKV